MPIIPTMDKAPKAKRGRPTLDPLEVRVRKTVRFKPAEWAAYSQAAGDLDLSEWIRQQLNKAAKRSGRKG